MDNTSFLIVTTSYLGTAFKTRSSFSHVRVGFQSFFNDTVAVLPILSTYWMLYECQSLPFVRHRLGCCSKLCTGHDRSFATHDVFQFHIACLFSHLMYQGSVPLWFRFVKVKENMTSRVCGLEEMTPLL